MSAEKETLRSMIGGRWAVSWQGYLLAWPWAVVFIFSASPTLWVSDTVAGGLLRGFIVGTAAYVPVGIVLWIAAITILRNRRITAVSIATVALVGGLAWTARTGVVLAYLQLEGLPSDVSPTARFIAGFVQGAFATVLAAWLLATISRFHDHRRQLLDDLIREELAADRLSRGVEEMRDEVLGDVQRTVDTTLQPIDFPTGDRLPSRQDVDALAHASQRISKDLARKLWSEAARDAHVDPLTVLRSAIMHRPFAYWGLIPGTLLGLFVLPIFWPWSATLISLAIVTLFAILFSAAANGLTSRLSQKRGMAVYTASILLLLGTAFVMQACMTLLNVAPPRGNGLVWAVAVNFGVLYPMIGVASHVGREQKRVIDQLKRSISEAEIRREALWLEEARLRRALALSLHGGLQADLTASAMRAQHALDDGDPLAATETLTQARDLINHAITLPEQRGTSLRETVASVIRAWDGIVDISADIHVSNEPDPRMVDTIKEVMIEGIGNAVRHGGANKIIIDIQQDDSTYQVTLKDDGRGFFGSSTGLGTSMFDSLAPGSWTLKPTSTGGSNLTVALRPSTT